MGAYSDVYIGQKNATSRTFGGSSYRGQQVPLTPSRLAWNYAGFWLDRIKNVDTFWKPGAITKMFGGRSVVDAWNTDVRKFNEMMATIFGPHIGIPPSMVKLDEYLAQGMLTVDESYRYWNAIGRLAGSAESIGAVPDATTIAGEAITEAGKELLKNTGKVFTWAWGSMPAIIRYGVPIAIGAYIYKAVK